MIMIKCLIKTTVFTNIFIIILKKNIYYIENKNLCIYFHINFFFNICKINKNLLYSINKKLYKFFILYKI